MTMFCMQFLDHWHVLVQFIIGMTKLVVVLMNQTLDMGPMTYVLTDIDN